MFLVQSINRSLNSERNNKADRNIVPGTTEDVEPGTCHTLDILISKPLYLFLVQSTGQTTQSKGSGRSLHGGVVNRFIDTGNR